MFRGSLLALAFAAAVALAEASETAPAMVLTTEWDMRLDASGNVASLALKPGLAREALREMLENAIRTWKFRPGAINGIPAATDTTLWVRLAFLPANGGDGYLIRIENVFTGGAVREYRAQPRFSQSRARAATHRKVLAQTVAVVADYDERGNVRDVVVADGSQVTSGPLVAEVLAAVRTWKFAPERIDGQGVGGHKVVRFCFDATGNQSGGLCSSDEILKDGPNSGAAESRVALVSEVVGSMLRSSDSP